MKKVLILARDVALAVLLFFGGLRVLAQSWPGVLGVVGVLLLLAAIVIVAKINALPYAGFDLSSLYRSYFPEDLRPLQYRRVSNVNRRFGLICCIGLFLMIILAYLTAPSAWGFVPYFVAISLLEVIGIFFYWRARYIMYRAHARPNARRSRRLGRDHEKRPDPKGSPRKFRDGARFPLSRE